MPLKTIKQTPRVALAQYGKWVMSYFPQTADIATIEQVEQLYKASAKQYGGIGLLTVMTADGLKAKVPDDVKAKSAQLLHGLGDQLIATSMVVLGNGFGATLLRTFMTGFVHFNKIKQPQKVFSNADDALVWMESVAKGSTTRRRYRADILKYCGLDFAGQKAA